jgi:hypothetical protein
VLDDSLGLVASISIMEGAILFVEGVKSLDISIRELIAKELCSCCFLGCLRLATVVNAIYKHNASKSRISAVERLICWAVRFLQRHINV